MSKKRLDIFLVENDFFETRMRAKSEIMAGNILVDDKKVVKAGTLIDEEANIRIIKKSFPYVSRGALKLVKALKGFSIDATNLICLDIGASTGGFTEVLLLNGAKRVYSIDVGYNQLAYKLRTDDRVISKEKINARYLTLETVNNELIDLVVTDVSFISLDKILKPAFEVLKEGGYMIALIKPQFEAGRGEVNKNGIITNKNVHRKVIEKIVGFSSMEVGFQVIDVLKSPITGTKGNVEFLLLLRKGDIGDSRITSDRINEVVFS